MDKDAAWRIFTNTGSIEAYLAYLQFKDVKKDADNDKGKRADTQDQRYTG